MENELRYMMGFTKPGDVFVDIGAHIGSYSVPMAKYLQIRRDRNAFPEDDFFVSKQPRGWDLRGGDRLFEDDEDIEELEWKLEEVERRNFEEDTIIFNNPDIVAKINNQLQLRKKIRREKSRISLEKRRTTSGPGIVYAFEPFRLYYQKLLANAAINGI